MASENLLSSTLSRTLTFDEPPPIETQGAAQNFLHTPVSVRFTSTSKKRRYTFHSRQHAAPSELSELRARGLQNAERLDNPFDESRLCCKKNLCFQRINKTQAFRWYMEIMAMPREGVKQTLWSWYYAGHSTFTFDGRPVCWRFLNQAFEFSNDLLSAVRSTERTRAAQTPFCQPRNNRRPTLRDSIITFLKVTAKSLGDDMPHRTFSTLPMTNKLQVYKLYVSWFNSTHPLRFSRSPPVIETFYSVWKKFVPDVKLMKNIGFEKCEDCVLLAEERARNLLNPTKLLEIRDTAKKDYDSVAAERRGYEMRKMQASSEPQHYLSMVVDGADQPCYGLPHFLQKSKEDRGHKIAVKRVGVLIHGVENDLFLYWMVEGFETGANHIIESVHRAIEVKKRRTGNLPHTLFVQVNNCTRENKNRYFLSYLEMFVARGVFVEVQMSSLEVGHKHTDVDQCFSCVHRRLDHHCAFSLNQLHDELRKCYTPTPHVEELTRIANFSSQCERSKKMTKARNYTAYRYFRLLRSSNDAEGGFYNTKCCVKRNLTDEWRDLPNAYGRGFILAPPDLLNLPETRTRQLPNVRDVNLCLRAAEARVRNNNVMEEIYSLRDKIYTPQVFEGHWTSGVFELHRNYRDGAERINPTNS